MLYGLPHPIHLLQDPISKESFKKLVKSKIVDHWEQKLRLEAAPLTSLSYFKPQFLSLCKPHPLLLSAGPNPYEVAKAIVQCKMLSGRYRTELLAKHWSSNKQGYCLAPTCSEVEESLEHILLWCPSYEPTRTKIKDLWLSTSCPTILKLVTTFLTDTPAIKMQFLLDAFVLPTEIKLN